jgi:membrane protein involved in colicin uptake
MKRLGLNSIGAALLLAFAASSSFAQNSATPDQRGSTGWTGGSSGTQDPNSNNQNNDAAPQNATDPAAAAAKAAADKDAADKAAAEQAAAQTARDAEAAKTQPLMAEGSDLNGTPRRFAPRQTVE